MSLETLRTQLQQVDDRIDQIIATGQEYTVVGSHSVKNPTLSELESRRNLLLRRIARYRGISTRPFKTIF